MVCYLTMAARTCNASRATQVYGMHAPASRHWTGPCPRTDAGAGAFLALVPGGRWQGMARFWCGDEAVQSQSCSVYCWSWSEDYRVERWKHRYNCQLMRRDQFCQFSACYSRGSSGSVAFSTGASRLVRPPFAAQSLHMLFEFIWRLL